ncbi:MAG: C4-type zinc ribbon domain-containing protein [Acidobacteriota bacterium]|nr:C4-type zinc ribbon domain-containing protein [Acidobacteriota bacterium]
MNDNIQRLIRLQEIAFEIRDLTARRDAVPKRLAELEAAFQEKIEEIGAERLTHETLVKEVAELREAEQENRQRLERAQRKLMEVSNQREYSAVLNEIDTTKTRLAQIVTEIGGREERIEELSGPAAEADERIAAERERTDQERSAIEQELSVIVSRLDELAAQKEDLVARLPAPYVRRFETIFKARQGVAMAKIFHGACGACHVRLRPQVINLVQRGEELVSCESCRRFLYTVPDVAAEAGDEPDPPAGPSSKEGVSRPGHSAATGS